MVWPAIRSCRPSWSAARFPVLVALVAAGELVAIGCNVTPEGEDTGGLVSSTGKDDVPATTIPVPEPSSTGEGSTTGTPDETTDGGSTTALDSTGSTDRGGSTDASTGEPGTTDGGSSSSGGTMATYDIEWCRLQYPPSVMVAAGEIFDVYVRFYVAGLTDLSGVNDPAGPDLVVEMGYGLDGSDPSMGIGAPWTWIPAGPNMGYGPASPLYEMNNDEYTADLSIPMAGIYDYASRISGDGGTTWVYCDLDDLLTGGYTPAQAGHAEVGP